MSRTTILATFVLAILQLTASQITFPTFIPPSSSPSCNLADYPSECPTYTDGTDVETFLTSSCQTLCSSKCLDPLLTYLENCNVPTETTSLLKAWCGTSDGNGQLCCTLGTTLSGSLAGVGFFTFCDNSITCSSSLVRSQCSTAYNSYGCCFANLDEFQLPTAKFNWAACGFSSPSTCYYDPWPLPISKEQLIAIVVGVGGGLLLLCIGSCIACICCCVCAAGAAGGRKRVKKVTTGEPINSGVEYQQFP